jgi:cell wall-associated NlpC family hydrolase
LNTLEKEQREAVVKEAISWIGTPYQHEARVKGAGVDCGMFLLEVFERCGLMEHIDIPHYPPDWHLHRGEQKYLGWVKKYCHKVDRKPLAGDLILYQWGRCISHGSIVIDYPIVIHSFLNHRMVCYSDTTQDPLRDRMRAIYSFW